MPSVEKGVEIAPGRRVGPPYLTRNSRQLVLPPYLVSISTFIPYLLLDPEHLNVEHNTRRCLAQIGLNTPETGGNIRLFKKVAVTNMKSKVLNDQPTEKNFSIALMEGVNSLKAGITPQEKLLAVESIYRTLA